MIRGVFEGEEEECEEHDERTPTRYNLVALAGPNPPTQLNHKGKDQRYNS